MAHLPDQERQQLLSLFKLKQSPRIHLLSDLHLEQGDYALPPDLEFDILVAAGDIGNLDKAVPWLAAIGKPVVYVLGNHERYGEDFLGAVDKARDLARGTAVHVLERNSIVIQGVRFLGATLWTDLRKLDPTFVNGVWNGLRDYLHIGAEQWLTDPARSKRLARLCKRAEIREPAPHHKTGRMMLHPGITYLEHQESLKWLKRQLVKDFAGQTVVVTHHAPSFESLRQHGISQDVINAKRWGFRDIEPAKIAGYASELLADLPAREREGISMWVHGHTHTAMDYVDHQVRVVTNPRGRQYPPLPPGDLAEMHRLGYRFGQERLEELRKQEQEQPYLGDGRRFDAHLVIDLLTGYERPIQFAVAPLLCKLEELSGELQELLPHTAEGEGVPARCVDEAFRNRIETVRATFESVQAKSVGLLDQWAGHAILGVLKCPYPPYVRTAWIGDRPVSRIDFEDALKSVVRVTEWTRQVHTSLRRYLLAWGGAAKASLEALHAAGLPGKLIALRPDAMVRCSRSDLHFILDDPGEEVKDYQYANNVKASELLEPLVNNKRIPRRWIVNFFDPEDATLKLLTLEDLWAVSARLPEADEQP